MKILFAASECVPFVKTGGLADVVGALPKALIGQGTDVRVILPLYAEIAKEWREKMTHLAYTYINLGWRRQYCGVESLRYEGITFYFIDNEYYFNRPYVYGGADEGERYLFFDRAVLEALPLLDFQPDVLHCHDWQTGMLPALLRRQYSSLPFYRNIKTLFTIHNLQYQGIFGIDYVEDLLNLGWEMYTPDLLEFYGGCSLMKAGLVFADRITTVSPTYAKEIRTAYYGERLDGLLSARKDCLSGVLNGIDTDEYNPQVDAYLQKQYGLCSHAEGKAACKRALQQELGLEVRPDVPLIGIISRLASQKGLDLIERVLADILALDVQIAVLGKGEQRFEELFRWAAYRYPGKVQSRIEMNGPLAHRIYAGSDLFLMPSAFEPCGLSQMISMRYGTVPIVRETGGLKDTVEPIDPPAATGEGFTFYSYNAHDMLDAVRRAVALYTEEPAAFDAAIQRGMQKDFSWQSSAGEYTRLYQGLLDEQGAPASVRE